MPSDVDIRISPMLHPANVKKVEGYSQVNAHYLAATESAFSACYEGLRAVYDARAAADQNRGWNEAQKALQVDKFATKKFDQIAKGLDRARGDLVKNIEAVEKELTAPLEGKSAGTIAAEVRAHVKALPTMPDRHAFIRQAIEAGDATTMGALLGAPAYLSGLTPDLQKSYLRQHREVMAPELAQRLKAMQGAKALIEQRGGLVFGELEKAIGMGHHKVAELRKEQDAAVKALELI